MFMSVDVPMCTWVHAKLMHVMDPDMNWKAMFVFETCHIIYAYTGPLIIINSTTHDNKNQTRTLDFPGIWSQKTLNISYGLISK